MKYIIFTGTITRVGGAQIYVKNKVNYMKSLGWDVYVFSDLDGPVLINGLSEFKNAIIPELNYYPNYFSNKECKNIISNILSLIDMKNDDNNVVIESNTGVISLWAEIVASKLNAAHFAFLLDENIDVDEGFKDFLYFKYKRNELALINEKIYYELFDDPKYELIHSAEVLGVTCSNVVEDISDPRFDDIPYDQYDYVICSLGRLNKGYIPNMIDGFYDFSKKHPDKSIAFIFIGDQPAGFFPDMKEVINQKFSDLSNVTIYQMGYVYPVPESFFKHIHAGVGCSGGARVMYKMMVPTVSIDASDNLPIGILGYTTTNTLYHDKEERKTLPDLLEQILIEGLSDDGFIPSEVTKAEDAFKGHIEFISRMSSIHDYYDVLSVKIKGKKNKVKKIFISTLGLKKYKSIKEKFKK